MPAMLVETAYISNPTEERLLTDPSYQRKLATAILRGFDTYFLRQPPPGTLYAARASAQQARSAAGGSPCRACVLLSVSLPRTRRRSVSFAWLASSLFPQPPSTKTHKREKMS